MGTMTPSWGILRFSEVTKPEPFGSRVPHAGLRQPTAGHSPWEHPQTAHPGSCLGLASSAPTRVLPYSKCSFSSGSLKGRDCSGRFSGNVEAIMIPCANSAKKVKMEPLYIFKPLCGKTTKIWECRTENDLAASFPHSVPLMKTNEPSPEGQTSGHARWPLWAPIPDAY